MGRCTSRGSRKMIESEVTTMYRQYENPFSLEDELKEARKRLAENPENIDLAIEVHELEDRVRFAWDDNEAETKEY